jgi:demethylmenaquinone methyltransferase/2-methoxy-6-polyprenyl-1,4-benzoquinol methylase
LCALLKQKAVDIFRGLAPEYDQVLDAFTLLQDRTWKSALLAKARLRPGKAVLDLACGTCILGDRVGSGGANVVGLDLSSGMLEVAKHKRGNLVDGLVRGDAESLPFPRGSFDLVVSAYLPKYCDPGLLLREVKRVLRPGGRLVAYDFSRPRGFIAPFHSYYVYGMLRALGLVTRGAFGRFEDTFTKLPGIIESSDWVEDWRRELGTAGFASFEETPLTGGIVTLFATDA